MEKVQKYGMPKSWYCRCLFHRCIKTNSSAVEKMVSHVIAIKMGESDYNIIQFKSGGPQTLTLTLITVARKESHAVTKRIYYDQEQPIPKKFCK